MDVLIIIMLIILCLLLIYLLVLIFVSLFIFVGAIVYNIKLYFFPRKRLKKPIEASRTVANSGYGKTATPEWIDDSTYLIFYQGKYTKLSQNHKKFLQLGLVKEASYKSFRKKSKINLKNEKDLIELVRFINSEV